MKFLTALRKSVATTLGLSLISISTLSLLLSCALGLFLLGLWFKGRPNELLEPFLWGFFGSLGMCFVGFALVGVFGFKRDEKVRRFVIPIVMVALGVILGVVAYFASDLRVMARLLLMLATWGLVVGALFPPRDDKKQPII